MAEAFVYVILQQAKEKDRAPTLSKNKQKKKSITQPRVIESNPVPSCNKKHSPPMARGSSPSNGQFAFEGGVASLSNVRRWARMQAKQKGKRKGETPKFPGKVS